MSTKKLEKNENGKSALSIININQIGKSLIRVLVITMLICTALKHGQSDVSGTANLIVHHVTGLVLFSVCLGVSPCP